MHHPQQTDRFWGLGMFTWPRRPLRPRPETAEPKRRSRKLTDWQRYTFLFVRCWTVHKPLQLKYVSDTIQKLSWLFGWSAFPTNTWRRGGARKELWSCLFLRLNARMFHFGIVHPSQQHLEDVSSSFTQMSSWIHHWIILGDTGQTCSKFYFQMEG